MCAKRLTDNLVYNNEHFGDEQVKEFKSIIRDAVYPENPEYSSRGGMAIAVRTFKTYEKSGGNKEGLIELMLFYVECGTQFTCSYGDIDENFYIALEEVFEDVLALIKESDTLDRFERRIRAIELAAHNVGWGYGDQIDELLDMNFPGFLKQEQV